MTSRSAVSRVALHQRLIRELRSGHIDQSHKMTAAAIQIAEKKV
jgi:hypothetical protein